MNVYHVLMSRRYGHVYIRKGERNPAVLIVEGDKIMLSFKSYGKSLESPKGHKYKCYAHFKDGTIVPTKFLYENLNQKVIQ